MCTFHFKDIFPLGKGMTNNERQRQRPMLVYGDA